MRSIGGVPDSRPNDFDGGLLRLFTSAITLIAMMLGGCSSRDFAHEQHTKAPEGAATGVAGGMVVGGALGWMIGIGALAVPGIGAFIAAGPLMAALAGAAAGGAAGGE
jgi:hypothetical protein